jgi:Glyoxalase/Bleomycin resistance protein/Dioxygenase superfamily
MLPHLRNRDYCQLAWVVPDLDAAVRNWVRTTGAGPFFLFDALHFDDANYRGTPMDVAPCVAAIGQFGEMQIELIQPSDNSPGIWGDVGPRDKTHFHHTGLYCQDYAAERAALVDEGHAVAFEGLMMGAKTCYIDTTPTLGFMTELITANPIADRVFAAFRAAAEGWDGTDPIRTLA